MSKIAVVGGGPAGMMAAYAAAKQGQVWLFEKNEKLGKKLFLTGKGRCNITNAAEMQGFFSSVRRNEKFLYSAFYGFTNQDLISLLKQNGLEIKEERGGRIFPVSDKSSDVIRTLERMLKNAGVHISLQAHVEDILAQDGKVSGIFVNGKILRFDKVILATGGYSYPSTGSTGEGHIMAEKLGHRIEPIHPSLIPFVCADPVCGRLQGLALKNISLSLYEGKQRLFWGQGEMLFTHFGLSGPLVLSASAHLTDYSFSDTKILIDLKPALDFAQLDRRILRDFDEFKDKVLKNAILKLYPRALGVEVLEKAMLDGQKPVSIVTREERERLVATTKAFGIKVLGVRSIEEAIITRGGINVREVNPSTMESRKISGLFFAGEILDLDAYTGGFNLQIAFSTGYLAGQG